MPTNHHLTLARYTYDPLDRQVNCTPSDQPYIQRYYCKTRLCTEIQGTVHRSILQYDDQLLAQYHREDTEVATALLATDLQRSVLHALHGQQPLGLAYTPYGHRPLSNSLLSLLGFNGEQPDPVTAHYHPGNGYRQFNPVLMRFNSPDNLSPFGNGGLNAYAYCGGDPRNQGDPTGHAPVRLDKLFLRKALGISDTPKSTLRASTLTGAVNPQATSSAASSTSVLPGGTTAFSRSRDPVAPTDTLTHKYSSQLRPEANMPPPSLLTSMRNPNPINPNLIDEALWSSRPVAHASAPLWVIRKAIERNSGFMAPLYRGIPSTPIQTPSGELARWKAVADQVGIRKT